MGGTSALAMAQYYIAAERPPHLACIAPWEGQSDLYRESLYEGGIPMIMFTEFATAGACGLEGIDDQGSMARRYPLMNAYWQSKIPEFEKIEVPAYICAGWNHFHLRGSINAFRWISSEKKWLRAHREFEWPDLYSHANIEDLRRFYDRYCKGINNGWETTPPVRIDVQDAYAEDYVVARPEDEFPLARTQYRRLYLDARDMSLSYSQADAPATASYDAIMQQAEFDVSFGEDTEITGYMKLHAFVEADGHDDMDLFITVKKIDLSGTEVPITIFNGTSPHPGAYGKIRVSHRELDLELSTDFQPIMSHRRQRKLKTGEVAEIEVEFYPTSRIWHEGEILRLQIAGRYIRAEHWIEPLIYEPDNKGMHIIHTGGDKASYLQIPVVGRKNDCGREFVVDVKKHPTHPIF
jgi:putative CocE/NonD family hydrolase